MRKQSIREMAKQKGNSCRRRLLIGYSVLIILLAVGLIVFYKFVFVTGDVLLSINLANDNSGNLKALAFVLGLGVLCYLVYRYFLKED